MTVDSFKFPLLLTYLQSVLLSKAWKVEPTYIGVSFWLFEKKGLFSNETAHLKIVARYKKFATLIKVEPKEWIHHVKRILRQHSPNFQTRKQSYRTVVLNSRDVSRNRDLENISPGLRTLQKSKQYQKMHTKYSISINKKI